MGRIAPFFNKKANIKQNKSEVKNNDGFNNYSRRADNLINI